MLRADSPVPLYRQLKNELLAQLRGGTLPAGAKLPSESALCRSYGVSRITVRQALGELEREGFVTSVQGKGTYVRTELIRPALLRVQSFSETLRGAGVTPETRLLSLAETELPAPAARELGCEAGVPCRRIELLGLADGSPAVYFDSCVLEPYGAELARALEAAPAQDRPVSTFSLYGELGLPVRRARQSIRAVNADRRLAALLGTRQGEALLQFRSVVLDRFERPVEYKESWYRSDRYAFTITRDFEESSSSL